MEPTTTTTAAATATAGVKCFTHPCDEDNLTLAAIAATVGVRVRAVEPRAVKRVRYEDKTVPTPGRKTTREIASEQYFWPFISLYEREVILKKVEDTLHADMDPADSEWIYEMNCFNYPVRVHTWSIGDGEGASILLPEAYEELVREIINSHKPVIVK